MARKVFISFLGSSFYGKCKYSYGEFTSSETRFVQQATLEWLKAKNGTYPDVAKILLTDSVKPLNWNREIRERENFQTKQKEEYFGLEYVLEYMGVKYQPVPTPEGKDEREIWIIFERIMNELAVGDELCLDITHGFRYLPMLLLVLSNFAKKTKQIKVLHISYGNFEGRDRTTNVAQFVDLLPLAEIQEERSRKIENLRGKYMAKLEKPKCPRVLVFGRSQIIEQQIHKIFEEHFRNAGFISKSVYIKDFVVIPFLDYEGAKNSNIMEKIDSDRFDYVIAGQHDHSIRGKAISTSLENYCAANNLKAKVLADADFALKQSQLTTLINQIVTDWKNN